MERIYENLSNSEYQLEIVEVSKLTPRYVDTWTNAERHIEVRLFLPETATYVRMEFPNYDVFPTLVTLQQWVYGDHYDVTERWFDTPIDAWVAVHEAAKYEPMPEWAYDELEDEDMVLV